MFLEENVYKSSYFRVSIELDMEFFCNKIFNEQVFVGYCSLTKYFLNKPVLNKVDNVSKAFFSTSNFRINHW